MRIRVAYSKKICSFTKQPFPRASRKVETFARFFTVANRCTEDWNMLIHRPRCSSNCCNAASLSSLWILIDSLVCARDELPMFDLLKFLWLAPCPNVCLWIKLAATGRAEQLRRSLKINRKSPRSRNPGFAEFYHRVVYVRKSRSRGTIVSANEEGSR